MNLMLTVKRREFVRCLVELISVAISHNLLDDAEQMLACVRQLRPRLEQLDFFEGWIAILRGDWAGATRIANVAMERTGDWPFATALLAYCQYATGERTWATMAERVLRQEDAPEARQLMLMLLGRVDPASIGADEALLSAISGGQDLLIESNFVRA